MSSLSPSSSIRRAKPASSLQPNTRSVSSRTQNTGFAKCSFCSSEIDVNVGVESGYDVSSKILKHFQNQCLEIPPAIKQQMPPATASTTEIQSFARMARDYQLSHLNEDIDHILQMLNIPLGKGIEHKQSSVAVSEPLSQSTAEKGFNQAEGCMGLSLEMFSPDAINHYHALETGSPVPVSQDKKAENIT